MKWKAFFQSFIGALIGIFVFEFFFEELEPFQSYWANYITELALLFTCISGGIFLTNTVTKKISFFQKEENS